MSVLDNLFDRPTTEHVQDAGQNVSIIYATALADSANGHVFVQLGDAITADEAMGADDESIELVDMDELGDDDTVADVDEDSDAEELATIDEDEGIEDPEEVSETDETDDDAEDVSGEQIEDD